MSIFSFAILDKDGFDGKGKLKIVYITRRREKMSDNFRTQLHDLGINKGDIILMHSSMKALQTTKTPIEFIEDILSVIGTEGTILIPAFTYDGVTAENPYFDVKESEPCVGLIPRSFYKMPGVVRSLHPTHSVCAYGKMASDLTSKHILDKTPVGPNSPIMKLLEYNGKILFIGDVLESCTFMHGVEEMVGTAYTLAKDCIHYVIKDNDGNIIEKDMFPHDFWGWGAEYQRIKNILEYPEIKMGQIGKANCYLIETSALLIKAKQKFNENPYYFVTDIREYM